jgi:hypothetical protein
MQQQLIATGLEKSKGLLPAALKKVTNPRVASAEQWYYRWDDFL